MPSSYLYGEVGGQPRLWFSLPGTDVGLWSPPQAIQDLTPVSVLIFRQNDKSGQQLFVGSLESQLTFQRRERLRPGALKQANGLSRVFGRGVAMALQQELTFRIHQLEVELAIFFPVLFE